MLERAGGTVSCSETRHGASRNNSLSPDMGEGQQQGLRFVSSPRRPPPKTSSLQLLTRCLQQPNFIFFSQILSHIILYIALGP